MSGTVEQIGGDRLAIVGPIVRPAGYGATTPPGWAVVPVGHNRGGEVEVAYDPGRFDVLVAHGEGSGRFPRLAHEDSAEVVVDALAVSGWQLYAFVGQARLWVRDRTAANQQSADHGEAGVSPRVRFNGAGR